MKKGMLAGCMVILGLVMGCATAKIIAVSNPPVQTGGNEYYEARLEPLKSSGNFFDSFRLTVSNKTGGNIEIDWNKTRYLFNGVAQEGLVYKGISPKDVRSGKVPLDTVPARQNATKVIYPLKLAAWVPAQERTLDKGLSPGLLPDGENGIALVVILDGKEVIERLTVKISEKEVK